MKKTAIGENPLDAILSSKGPKKMTPTIRSVKKLKPQIVSARVVSDEKVRATFHLSAPLLDELRDAVVALSGPPYRLTLGGLAEDALKDKLEDLKKEANKGRPFPKREGELKGGRPIGSGRPR